MSYTQKLFSIKNAILLDCKLIITDKWNDSFLEWLRLQADMEFGFTYLVKFDEQFSQYIDNTIKYKLWTSSKNLQFAIRAFMKYHFNSNLQLEELLEFTEIFIKEQFNDFDNWCDEIKNTI